MSTTPAATYTVADYLFDRIAELGTTDVFGVPGDFNLPFLDNVLAHPTLNWVGNNNELNAAYCADGYARVRGFAAMVTTFGVGELSAINGTAGAFAEYSPVLHIVGAPSRATQKTGLKVHHTLGDGKFTHFYEMARPVNCAQAWLTPANAAYEIDRVITSMLTHRRPGYILLSPDVARSEIYRPDHRLDAGARPRSSSAALAAFTAAAAKFLDGTQATVLADLLVHRLGAWTNLKDFLSTSKLPYATLAWGKSLVDERSDQFAGIYAGAASSVRPKDAVENAERLISVGVEFTDNTTAGFSMELDADRIIDIQPDQATVGGRAFAPIFMADALDALAAVIDGSAEQTATVEAYPLKDDDAEKPAPLPGDAPLAQQDLWPIVTEWMPEDSIILADQGTSFFGMADKAIPNGAMFIGQPLWGSIGYTLPASVGAAIADRDRRAVLLIGDGSAQLTVQEISTHLREKTNPLILLVNNDGYTVERAIHGPEQDYNDIARYDWQAIPAAFGGTPDTAVSLKATTSDELRAALAEANKQRDKLVLLEAVTEPMDLPAFLADICAALARSKES